MKRLIRAIRDRLGAIGGERDRSGGVERFVQLICGGGVALIAGLWTVTLSSAWSTPWLLGAAVVALGVGGLVAGIGSEIEGRER